MCKCMHVYTCVYIYIYTVRFRIYGLGLELLRLINLLLGLRLEASTESTKSHKDIREKRNWV